MRLKTTGGTALIVMAFAALTAFPAHAQGIGGLRPPPVVLRPAGAAGVVQDMAKALGSFRQVIPAGTQRGVNGVMFTATGQLAEVTRAGIGAPLPASITTEITYYPHSQGVARSPGIRHDVTTQRKGGKQREAKQRQARQREVWAAADGQAWNEPEPGGKATAAASAAAARLAEIWMSPHGLIWAAVDKDGKALAPGVSSDVQGGKTVLTIPVGGMSIQARLNAEHRPEYVAARIKHPQLGTALLEFEYSDYRDFEMAYGVYFPARIVKKLNRRTVMDVSVNEYHTNPYSVFPLPQEVL